MTVSVLPSAGKAENGIFFFPIRVYYEDTDAGGIVYYANYLKFSERVRSEFLRFLGIDQQSQLRNNHSGFVVRSCNIKYKSSAVLDDVLTVTCQIKEVSPISALLYQEIRRGEEVLTILEVEVVHISLDRHRPIRIPEDWRRRFDDFMQTQI